MPADSYPNISDIATAQGQNHVPVIPRTPGLTGFVPSTKPAADEGAYRLPLQNNDRPIGGGIIAAQSIAHNAVDILTHVRATLSYIEAQLQVSATPELLRVKHRLEEAELAARQHLKSHA